MANLHDVQNLQMEDDNSFNSEVLWQRIPVETSFTKLPQVILGFQLLGVGVNAGELRIQIRMFVGCDALGLLNSQEPKSTV